MHHWTVHEKVDFPKILPGTAGVSSTTFHHELRNERFTLISFIGFPAILSTLQPFQICICNRKYSKWTFLNGPHMTGKRFMVNLHASLDSTWKSRFSQNSTRYWGVSSTTFHHELRNERFTLISFIGFPAILSTLQPFQICICNRKYSKWTFSNSPHMTGKRFMANLHASLDSTWKSRFSQNSTRYLGGVYSTTFDTKLRNEVKKFSNTGGVHSTTCDSTVRNAFKKFPNCYNLFYCQEC